MKIAYRRGRLLTIDQIKTGELFRYCNNYYMKCLFVTEDCDRYYWAVNLCDGTIVSTIPDNTLVEVFDDAEVFIK